MSINKWFYLVAFSIAFILLVGCSVGPDERTAETGEGTPIMYPTRTKTPTVTVSPTATEIPTVVPLVTASPGPAPELELRNINLINHTNEFVFMAETRNNSGEPMIFNEREIGIRLQFEQWWKYVGYHHVFLEAPLRPLSGSVQRMNCILYPDETGILVFTTWNTCDDRTCPRKDEISQEPPGQLGTRLIGYQATPRRWEDLRNLYPFNQAYYHYPEKLDEYAHPEAQNLTYRIDGSKIIIEYDTDLDLPTFGDVDVAWLILYDGDGIIINVLYSHDNFCNQKSCLGLDRYHVKGIGSNSRPMLQSATPGVYPTWWRPLFDLTDDQLKQVNSIRVFTELQDWNICENYLE
jgi:hypothetical protein